MDINLNLEKSSETLKLCLQKAGLHTPPEVEVCFNMDVSGSFEREHKLGYTNALMNRMVPWGMVFDPDKKLDLFTFSDGNSHAYYVGEVTSDNCQDYIANNVCDKVPGWNCGTDFSYVLKKNLEQFGWEGKKEQGFFSRLFGKKDTRTPRKSLILHITDGEASDIPKTTQVLRDIEENGYKVYVIFFGIGTNPSGSKDIRNLADRFDNVSCFICDDIRGFITMTDEQINEALISDKLINYLKK